ncbi:B-box type Zinc finger protein ncl-1 [Plakobranchus ocellatus]|uniref:B-box type Zinc finger protein ncl-1 n=1 Tax=Plakobranchus ocellatus TaxID=259542 RepID=A0AAV3XYA3_9GAST|nr:B-box type Zinc finger protein ncl-1 [Plakobranchus ocellatus]
MANEKESAISPVGGTQTEESSGDMSLEGALEEEQAIDVCLLCDEKMKNPKVLNCLHEFCEACLKQKLSDSENKSTSPTNLTMKDEPEIINCPSCGQQTILSERGVNGLLSDTVLEDMIQSDSSETKQIGCTSCKAGDNAVARCQTCENLLCPNCVTAHQFMRCFEDHKVITFEDMISSGEGIDHLRKPVFCPIHSVETIKFFCCSCLMPVCSECVDKSHSSPEHAVKQLAEAVGAKKETLAEFTKECGKKLAECQTISGNLNSAFEDLEMQKDNSKDLINETFQSYKAVLEEMRDTFLKELDELHKKRELGLMERMQKLSTYESQLSQAKSFVERICERGHVGQVAVLLQTMLKQLNTLCMGFIMPDIPVNTEFKTDPVVFSAAVKETFGCFTKEKNDMSGVTSPFESERFGLSNLNLRHEQIMKGAGNSELVNLGNLGSAPMNSIALAQGINSLPISNVMTGLGSMSLTQPDNSIISGNNSPHSDSGISVDNVSHSSGGHAAMMNAAAMAKMHQSQSPLFAPGMSLTGASAGSGANAITSGSGDNSLANILGSAAPVSSGNSVQNVNIEGLASLLNQPPPQSMSSLSAINTYDPFTSASASSELGSPNSTYSNEPYPPVRRTNKMNAMQISRFQSSPTETNFNRFQGGLGDTEIGHWGPQLKQINEVALRCKFGQLGPGKGQFNSPHGFCLGVDEDIVVADTNNHRVQVFTKSGEFKYQFGIPGREEGQLWYPRKVAVVIKTGKFVVCDRGNERSRMQIFNRNGHFLKKIAIRYIDIVAGLAIFSEGHIVAVDSVSPTVFVIAESGDLIKWFDCSDYMREPSDIAINNNEYFVCDFKGHCVVVFSRDGVFLRRIGCENITNYPNGIDISGHGDVLIGDSHGNRFHVGVFQRDGSLITEFQCPYVKVSRCCGLKITTEGYIVTLAKNNHHVLVLNTLYIP